MSRSTVLLQIAMQSAKNTKRSLTDRQDRHKSTPLHKDPWRSVQKAVTSLLNHLNHYRNAT